MPTFDERSIEITAEDIGDFLLSEELRTAGVDLIAEIGNSITALTDQVSNSCPMLGEQAAYFGRGSSRSSQIIASFLSKAFQDLENVLDDSEEAFRRPSLLLSHTLMENVEERPNHFDGLAYPYDAPIGVRYITSNKYPTRIESLPRYTAGHIARFRPDRDPHGLPKVTSSPDHPRLLLWLDIL